MASLRPVSGPEQTFRQSPRHGLAPQKSGSIFHNAVGSEGYAALIQQVTATAGRPDEYYPPWTSPEQSIIGTFTARLKCLAIRELGKVEIAAL